MKKKTAPKGRKRCSEASCRKLREPNGLFCLLHSGKPEEPPKDVMEEIVKLNEIETLSFRALDAELRNVRLGIANKKYQIRDLQKEQQRQMDGMAEMLQHLENLETGAQAQYNELIVRLAGKYGIEDPAQMTIDTDTGIIRDLKKKT